MKIKYKLYLWSHTPGKDKPVFILNANGFDHEGDKLMDEAELQQCERGLFTPHDVVTIDGGYQVVLA